MVSAVEHVQEVLDGPHLWGAHKRKPYETLGSLRQVLGSSF